MKLNKQVVYYGSLCCTLGLLVCAWVSSGFSDFGASADAPYIPFLLGSCAMVAVFEPVMSVEAVGRRILRLSRIQLARRGATCGSVVFAMWSFLYSYGLENPGSEFVLVMIGYTLGLVVAFLTVWLKNGAEQGGEP